jgi:hypothetical protein
VHAPVNVQDAFTGFGEHSNPAAKCSLDEFGRGEFATAPNVFFARFVLMQCGRLLGNDLAALLAIARVANTHRGRSRLGAVSQKDARYDLEQIAATYVHTKTTRRDNHPGTLPYSKLFSPEQSANF